VAHPPRLSINDIRTWAVTRKVGVAVCDEYVVSPLKKLGIQVQLFNGFHNPHAFSAACRESAYMQVLKHVGRGKQQLSILDLFGSPRTLSYNPRVSAPFGTLTRVNGQTASSRTMNIDWCLAPDLAVQGDAARGVQLRVPIPDRMFDAVIACDIYQSGDAASTPFTSTAAREYISRSTSGCMYWIGRFFPGEMGCDEPICLDDGTIVVEQMFVKNEHGLVLSSPDASSGFYAPHPWPEWLEQRHFDGLDVSPVSKVGPYRIVRIALGVPNAIQIVPNPCDIGMATLMSVDSTDYWLWFVPVYATKKVVVCVSPFLKVSPKLVRKIPHGQLLDMAQVLVAKEFDTPTLNAFRDRFPLFYAKMVSDTVLASLYFGRRNDSEQLARLRQAHTASETRLVRARAQANDTRIPFREMFLVGAGVAFSASMYVLRTRIGSVQATFRAFGSNNSVGAWILPQHPLLSALLEEGLAYCSESAALLGVLFEAITSTEQEKPLGRLAMHLGASLLRVYCGPFGRFSACVLHLGWNYVQTMRGRRFQLFSETFGRGELMQDTIECVEPIPAGTTLPSYTAIMTSGPEAFRGEISVFVDGCCVSVADAFEALGRPVGRNLIYPVLITQRLLQQPANNETNLLAAALMRVHNDPFVGSRFTARERHHNWEKLGRYFCCHLIGDLRCAVYSVEDNIRIMGRKGARLQRAYVENMSGVSLFSGKTINLKWNETITSQKEVNGILTMKPRAIQNLPPLTHALMGGEARSFADELHHLFDGRTFDLAGHSVRIFFASGYDQKKLSDIGRAAQAGHSVFAMSGDDSFVAWGGIRPSFGCEADQSQFDHTQDDGPMKFFMGQILRKFGLSDEFIALAYNACSSGYTLRKGRLFAKGSAGTQMPTGITTTTSFNSLSTLAMFVWFILNEDRFSDLADAGAELGFKVKCFERDDVFTSTFLKGWWQQGEDGVDWIPLPSACLKIGKLLNNPIEITRVIRRGKKHRLGLQEAIRQCSTSLAQSYGTVDRSYPILGEFLFTMSRLGKQPRRVVGSLQESWKPNMTHVAVDRAVALEAIECRYGITVEEVISVEALLRSVTTLPSYIEHSVFDKLCEVDY